MKTALLKYPLYSLVVILCILPNTAVLSKPTRSECIIGYNLDWSNVRDRHSVQDAMLIPLNSSRTAQFVAAQSFSFDNSMLFLQYKDHCDQRREMAAQLIQYWKATGIDLPRLSIIAGPIEPSPSTIDVQGSAWRDSPPSTAITISSRYPPVEVATGLYDLCNRDDDNAKSVCAGFIGGVFEVATNNPIDRKRSCLTQPKNVSAIRTEVLEWIHSHPEKAQEPASSVIAEAMAEAFPCKN
jgi:Rap1a immunity proteins